MEKKIAVYGPGGDSGTVRQEIVPLHMCLALQASPRPTPPKEKKPNTPYLRNKELPLP